MPNEPRISIEQLHKQVELIIDFLEALTVGSPSLSSGKLGLRAQDKMKAILKELGRDIQKKHLFSE